MKSYEHAEKIADNGAGNPYALDITGPALDAFAAYLDSGGDIHESDRDGTTALEICSRLASHPGPGGAQLKQATRTRATQLRTWLLTRGATH